MRLATDPALGPDGPTVLSECWRPEHKTGDIESPKANRSTEFPTITTKAYSTPLGGSARSKFCGHEISAMIDNPIGTLRYLGVHICFRRA